MKKMFLDSLGRPLKVLQKLLWLNSFFLMQQLDVHNNIYYNVNTVVHFRTPNTEKLSVNNIISTVKVYIVKGIPA